MPVKFSRSHKALLFHNMASIAAVVLGLAAIDALPAAEPDDAPEIVVTAIPQKPDELKRAVNRFVTQISQVSDQGQLARRSGQFCPAVAGLEEKYIPIVLRHLRDAAAAAGVAEAPTGCRSNLAIIFSTDGDGLVEALNKRKPRLFQGMGPQKAKEIFDSGRPIRWWYGKNARDADGTEPIEGVLRVYSMSLIATNIRINISGTIVIIDVTKAEGYPLDAVASYAAMVSFAELSGRQAALADVPSVLGMFVRTGPRTRALKQLTAWDRAYLAALYDVPAERPSFTQRRLMAGRMRNQLSGVPD